MLIATILRAGIGKFNTLSGLIKRLIFSDVEHDISIVSAYMLIGSFDAVIIFQQRMKNLLGTLSSRWRMFWAYGLSFTLLHPSNHDYVGPNRSLLSIVSKTSGPVLMMDTGTPKESSISLMNFFAFDGKSSKRLMP